MVKIIKLLFIKSLMALTITMVLKPINTQAKYIIGNGISDGKECILKEGLEYKGIPTKELELILNKKMEIKTETENPRTKYTDREILLLKQLSVAEANGEGVEGMVYVMQTVENRVASDLFPNSIEEVIYENGQFSTVPAALERAVPTAEADKAFEQLGDFNNQGQLFFESVSCKGTWASSHRQVLYSYGGHRFYR